MGDHTSGKCDQDLRDLGGFLEKSREISENGDFRVWEDFRTPPGNLENPGKSGISGTPKFPKISNPGGKIPKFREFPGGFFPDPFFARLHAQGIFGGQKSAHFSPPEKYIY